MNLLNEQLNELNEKQLEAVKHVDEPLFVVAGAGTGKTKTLTTKIAYLIKHLNVDPENILAVTFTNKAAKEIRTRINTLIYPYQMGSWLYTFHAFGLRVLREHAVDLNLGYTNDFNVIDSQESKDLIKDVIDRLDLKDKIKLGDAVSVLSNYKMLIESDLEIDFFDIYKEYEKDLINNNLMDFDDLVKYILVLFDLDKTILNKYQQQFKYVLVDEFQDTDLIQYEIIKSLNSKNTFVVGDPDQSIYSFRGARYFNNELFLSDFKAKTIILDENYRSTNNILKSANKVIKNNESRKTEKDLVSNLGTGSPVVISRFNNDLDEVDYIINEILKLRSMGYTYNDFAILYRNNALSRNFEHKFITQDLPYVIYGGISFYQRKEVKDILTYLKLVINNDNNYFLKRVVNKPKRGIGPKTIDSLEEYSVLNNISMFEAIDSIDLSKRMINSLKEFKQAIEAIKSKINGLDNIRDIVELVYNLTNYELEMDSDSLEVKADRLDNINELKTVFSLANSNYKGSNLDKLRQTLDELALFTDQEITHDLNNSIKLSTVHQVKGLEFKVVFVVAVEEEIFPNHRSIYDRSKLEEERRLFYVALTRAKEHLYITGAISRRLYGTFHFQKPSRFVAELEKQNFVNNKQTNEVEAFDNKTVFSLTDVVEHDAFGKGIIVAIKEDVLTVAFSSEFGVKQIKSTFRGIKRVKK